MASQYAINGGQGKHFVEVKPVNATQFFKVGIMAIISD